MLALPRARAAKTETVARLSPAHPAPGESPANLGEQLFALLLVTRERPLDYCARRVRRPNVFDLHELAFELLVVLEKALQHQQPVRWQIARLYVSAKLRIVGGHRNDFVIARAGVDHGHQPNSAR